MTDKHILILFSGGADSCLLFHWAVAKFNYRTTLLHFTYEGQDKEETGTALIFPSQQSYLSSKTRWLVQDVSFPTLRPTVEGDPDSYIPGRNTIFAGYALSFAESNGVDEVWVGANYSDKMPDGQPHWVKLMDQVASTCYSRRMRVLAPLLGLTKQQVIGMLQSEGVDLSKVHGNYTGA